MCLYVLCLFVLVVACNVRSWVSARMTRRGHFARTRNSELGGNGDVEELCCECNCAVSISEDDERQQV